MVELIISINDSYTASPREEKGGTETIWTRACFIKKNFVTMVLLQFNYFFLFRFLYFITLLSQR